jgi:hypothetical protein
MKKFSVALVALLIGGLIYVFWRSKTLTMFCWFEQMGLKGVVETFRANPWVSQNYPDWFVYSLPNALWLFSGILVFDSIWDSERSTGKTFWVSLFLIIGFGAELAQGLKLLPGFFDWQDMAFMIMASLGAHATIVCLNHKERGLVR